MYVTLCDIMWSGDDMSQQLWNKCICKETVFIIDFVNHRHSYMQMFAYLIYWPTLNNSQLFQTNTQLFQFITHLK